jgi:proteasome lid subunit RPN8/RPN11
VSRAKIRLPAYITEQIREALLKYGSRECGGILMGEHVGHDEFRVVDLTVQSQAGTISRFVRAVASFVTKLAAFFERTEYRYQKYNYLGEWHSHPLFALQPSRDDFLTMRDIIDDSEVGANFVVLMLAKLSNGNVESKAWTLIPGGVLIEADVIPEGATHDRQ